MFFFGFLAPSLFSLQLLLASSYHCQVGSDLAVSKLEHIQLVSTGWITLICILSLLCQGVMGGQGGCERITLLFNHLETYSSL